MARGELEFVTVGKRRRFTEEQIERHLHRHQVSAEAGPNGSGNLAGPLADWVRAKGYRMSEEALTEQLRKRGASAEEIPALVALGDQLAGMPGYSPATDETDCDAYVLTRTGPYHVREPSTATS